LLLNQLNVAQQLLVIERHTDRQRPDRRRNIQPQSLRIAELSRRQNDTAGVHEQLITYRAVRTIDSRLQQEWR
jgi:hypothetical protein